MSAPLEVLQPEPRTTLDHDEFSSRLRPSRATVPLHLPYAAIFWAFMCLLAFAIWTHYAGGPMLYHLVVGGALLFSVVKLLELESKPNTVAKSEFICAVCLIVSGGLLFSSPAIQPYVQQCLRYMKVFPSMKLEDGPSREMYDLKDGTIYPTNLVLEEFELIVGFDKVVKDSGPTVFTQMKPLTKKGVKIGTKDAEVWLQNRATGATSNSIPVERDSTPANAPTTPETSQAPKAEQQPVVEDPPKVDEPAKVDEPPTNEPPAKDNPPPTDDPDPTELEGDRA